MSNTDFAISGSFYDVYQPDGETFFRFIRRISNESTRNYGFHKASINKCIDSYDFISFFISFQHIP